MPNRKIPSSVSLIASRHFYRSADLRGPRLILWENGTCASVADYLSDAGAEIITGEFDTSALTLDESPWQHRPPPFAALNEKATKIDLSRVTAMDRPSALLVQKQIDAAVLNLRNFVPLPDRLKRAGIPVVIYTDEFPDCLTFYPQASCIAREDGPEVLASAILLRTALHRSGLCHTGDMTITQMVPRLRAMARFLVQDIQLADDLVALSMEEAYTLLPQLVSEQDLRALLVTLVEQIWRRQKMSRLN